jgi:hypothetical protein
MKKIKYTYINTHTISWLRSIWMNCVEGNFVVWGKKFDKWMNGWIDEWKKKIGNNKGWENVHSHLACVLCVIDFTWI